MASRLHRKLESMGRILGMRPVRLPHPRVAITLDSGEPDWEGELRPIFEVMARRRVPVTAFVCNRTENGRDNGPAVRALTEFGQREGLPVEIASHGLDHRNLAGLEPGEIARFIHGSLDAFRAEGLNVAGFRSAELGTELRYREVLDRLDPACALRYDSSVCFESGLASTALQAALRKKGPHRVGQRWELPISVLDDYHLFARMQKTERFALNYWTLNARWWLNRMNYTLLLLHPRHIGPRLELLEELLTRLGTMSPRPLFATCAEMVDELDSCFPEIRSAGEKG
jgi:peptidoglycan/xylan/chitin deacetylase (PgdA/CDA1 family)